MKRKARNYLLIYILVFIAHSSVFAQNRKLAADFFDKEDFESAYEEYSLLIENFNDDLEFEYRLAVCVLNLNMPKTEAINLLENLVKNELSDPNALFLLGRAYQYENRFEEAERIRPVKASNRIQVR